MKIRSVSTITSNPELCRNMMNFVYMTAIDCDTVDLLTSVEVCGWFLCGGHMLGNFT